MRDHFTICKKLAECSSVLIRQLLIFQVDDVRLIDAPRLDRRLKALRDPGILRKLDLNDGPKAG